jgi:hypothetical protein
MSCAAELQPVSYAPLGMWAMQSPSPLADRSGNARDLTGTVPSSSKRPDVQRGRTCVKGVVAGYVQTDPVFRLTGAMTITARFWFDGNADVNVIADQSLVGVGLQYNTLFTVGISNAQLFYYREINGAIGAVGVASTVNLEPYRWYFGSWRRAVNGNITIGVDGGSMQTFVVTPPVDGSSTRLTLGTDPVPQIFRGGFSDVAIWGARLTDSQTRTLWRASMGE